MGLDDDPRPHRVTLTGLRGSGKSTVGPPLADRLGWAFVDADAEIERRTGRSIPDLFAADGEPAFRTVEREVMADLLGRDRVVIAAGGGALMDGGTREGAAAGFVVYLAAPPDVLARRVAGDAVNPDRPPLTDADPVDEMRAVFARRDPVYRGCADLVVDVSDVRPDRIAAMIEANVAERRGSTPPLGGSAAP